MCSIVAYLLVMLQVLIMLQVLQCSAVQCSAVQWYYFAFSVNILPSKWLFFHHCYFFPSVLLFSFSVTFFLQCDLRFLQCDLRSFSMTSDPSVLLEISSVCLEISSEQLGFDTFHQIVPTSLVQVYYLGSVLCNMPLAPRKYWRVWFQYSIVKNDIM